MKIRKMKKSVLLSLAIIIAALLLILIKMLFSVPTPLAGVTFYEHETANSSSDDFTETPTSNIPTTSPMISNVPSKIPTTNPNIKKKNYTQLTKDLKKYLSKFDGTYGIYFISLTSGSAFGINEKEEYVAASTIKAPINLYLFRQIAAKKINPTTKLTYEERFYEEGTGSIQYEEVGTRYTIKELSRRSIEESDNVAINMLVNYLGWDNVKNYFETTLKHPVNFEENLFTPRDMGIFMKSIYDYSRSNKKEGVELVTYLQNTCYNDRIPKFLPEGTVVAHKIGSQIGAINDVGIIYAPNPFILCVMSKNIDEDISPDVISYIAQMVYNFEQQN